MSFRSKQARRCKRRNQLRKKASRKARQYYAGQKSSSFAGAEPYTSISRTEGN